MSTDKTTLYSLNVIASPLGADPASSGVTPRAWTAERERSGMLTGLQEESMKRARQTFSTEFKRRVVEEFLGGHASQA